MFLDGMPEHAVQQLDSICGVDNLADVQRISEERDWASSGRL